MHADGLRSRAAPAHRAGAGRAGVLSAEREERSPGAGRASAEPEERSPGAGRASTARTFFLDAFGDPGHAFPVIALGRELAARGHDVTLQTWARWREDIEREGMRFASAPEYHVWPKGGLAPYAAAVRAANEMQGLVDELAPDALVADILTTAGGLVAQRSDIPWATLVPHVYPITERGMPPYSSGARMPRTPLGSAIWRLPYPLMEKGVERGRRELNGARVRVGLPEIDHGHGGISHQLALVTTFPQLEYPREKTDPWMRVTGPLLWERPFGEVELPPGDEPLVLVAPSTSQDPDHRLVRATLAGLANEPVRVLAALNRRPFRDPLPDVPANARVVDWVSYTKTMPRCAAVVCHAGHGTVVRALASGVPVVGCPAAGDMAENAARLAWSGTGVSLPRRLVTARGVRLAVRRLLAEPAYAARAGELAAWAATHDGASTAADLVEGLAAGSREAAPGSFTA